MKISYRISDGGNNKPKPDYVYNKKLMFLHFIKIFANYDIYVFADNVKDDTYTFLDDKCVNCNNLNFNCYKCYIYYKKVTNTKTVVTILNILPVSM